MGSGNLPKEVLKDGAKWLLAPCKVFLEMVCIWPDSQSRKTLVWHWFCIFTYVFFIYGNFYYITRENANLGTIANALMKLSIMVETTLRHILLLIYKDRLNKVLYVVYYQFRPSNSYGDDLDLELRKGSRNLFIYCVFYISSAIICCMQYVATTIMQKDVPFITAFPFAWRDNPVYFGLLYAWQGVMVGELVISICTLDIFYVSLIYNCITQLKLLRENIKKNFEKCTEKDKFVRNCVKEHNHLIRICEELDDIFSQFILIQVLLAIGTICLSSFLATAVPERIGDAVTYLTGHLCALLIYCYMGNELQLESAALSDTVYSSGWHLSNADKNLQKSLVLIMVRSQKTIKISSGGFGYLTLESFMKLIRFSFSVYTLLNKMLQKQNEE